MALIHAYLRFNGNAKEAFALYQRCLDGELTITTAGQSPMAQFMPEKKDHVFHAQLQKVKKVSKKGIPWFLRSNARVKMKLKRILRNFQKGTICHPLSEQPFGGNGDFSDKFGVDWFAVF
jgi:PhnB protein